MDVRPFHTAFVRPDEFRFQYDNPTPDKPYIIWGKAGKVSTWWHARPGVEKAASLDSATAAATGVSSASAHTIPSLLMPDRLTGAKLSAMRDLIRLPDDTVGGTSCFKLEGKYGFGNQPMTVWLEKATFLVRRLGEGTGLAKSTTDYSPEVNVEIPAKELEVNAPESQEGQPKQR